MEPVHGIKNTIYINQLVELVALCHLNKVSFAATNKHSDEKWSDPDVIQLSFASAVSQELLQFVPSAVTNHYGKLLFRSSGLHCSV